MSVVFLLEDLQEEAVFSCELLLCLSLKCPVGCLVEKAAGEEEVRKGRSVWRELRNKKTACSDVHL
jgi:hypothetical protein